MAQIPTKPLDKKVAQIPDSAHDKNPRADCDGLGGDAAKVARMARIPVVTKRESPGPMIDYLGLTIPKERIVAAAVNEILRHCYVRTYRNPEGKTVNSKHLTRVLCPGLSISEQGDLIVLSGSPARLGKGNNVFGSPDIKDCGSRMIATASAITGIDFPSDLKLWGCSRIDATDNYLLASEDAVDRALTAIRGAMSVRDRHQRRTVYFGSERYLEKVCYAKGEHLRRQMKRGEAKATEDQLHTCNHFLRLELRLGSKYLDRQPRHWSELSSSELEALHRKEFRKVLPHKLFVETNSFPQAPARLDGASTVVREFADDLRIHGIDAVRQFMPARTWFRNVRRLAELGLTPRMLVAGDDGLSVCLDLDKPVRSWDECRALMGGMTDKQAGDGDKQQASPKRWIDDVAASIPLSRRGTRPGAMIGWGGPSPVAMRPIARAVGMAIPGP